MDAFRQLVLCKHMLLLLLHKGRKNKMQYTVPSIPTVYTHRFGKYTTASAVSFPN